MEIDVPGGEVLVAGTPQAGDRRTERRYRLEMPLRVQWRASTGEVKQTQGVVQDISRSGISFLAPEGFQADQPFEVELVLPDEITHCGDIGVRLPAQPVRQARLNGTATSEVFKVGVAARLNPPAGSPSTLPAPASGKTKNQGSRGK
jgi:hypothetical protein